MFRIPCILVGFAAAWWLGIASVRADLVAHWGLDDNTSTSTVFNSVSDANNGVLTDAATTSAAHVSGKIGGAIDFGGVRAVDIANARTLLDSMTNFTVSAWVKDYVAGSEDNQVVAFGGYNSPTPDLISRSQLGITRNEFFRYSSNGNPYCTSLQTWTEGQWYQLTVTQSGGAVSMYLDGEAVSVTGVSTGHMAPSSVLQDCIRIGSLAGVSGYFSGKMDDVAMWNSVLSDAEIKAINSLANATLNYSAAQANVLFSAFADESDTAVGGMAWRYAASGIGGADGEVIDLGGGNYSLNLGGGAGMYTVPEPCAMAMLASGLIGLLAYAWRKRT